MNMSYNSYAYLTDYLDSNISDDASEQKILDIIVNKIENLFQ